MTSTKKPKVEYDVGYGKPPNHTKFKKGQSGNPRGKAKGKKSLKTILAEELLSQMTIGLNGKSVTGTRQRLMFQTLTAKAAVGDIASQRLLLPLMLQIIGAEGMDAGKPALTAQDQRLLDEMLAEFGINDPPTPPDPSTDKNDGASPNPSDDEEHF